jgi:hypothetical protein
MTPCILIIQDLSPSQSKKNNIDVKNTIFCLYYEKLSHVAHHCPKKHVPHATQAIFVTNPQLEELENKYVQSR